MFILGNGGIDDGACIVEMFQLKIIPLFSCFERVTCFFIYFYSYVVKLMVPIFLVHIWNDLPRPLKSQEEGTRNAFWVIRPPFCLYGRSDLPTQHDWLCHRQPNNNKPQKNLPRITCHILFCLTFMQLFIYNYKEFPNTHYSWLLSCLKTVPWGCWPLSALPKAATRITLAA